MLTLQEFYSKANQIFEKYKNLVLLNGGSADDVPEDIQEIESCCNELFISSGGPNYSNISKFNDLGNLHIAPGEIDSFGWLSGKLKNAKGQFLIFG